MFRKDFRIPDPLGSRERQKNEEYNADTSTDIAFFRGKLAAFESILKVNSKT